MRQATWIFGLCVKDHKVFHFARYWDLLSLHGHMEHAEILSQGRYKVGDSWKDYWSRFAADFFCNLKFWKQLSEYSYRECMVTPCFESMGNITLDGVLIQDIAAIQSVDALICKFYFQEWAIFCLYVITYLDSFEKPVLGNVQNNTLKSMFWGCSISKM